MPYSLDNICIAPWENIILLRRPQWVAWIMSSFSVRWNPARSYFECIILMTVDVILKLGTSHASRQPAILNTHITSVVLENHFLGKNNSQVSGLKAIWKPPCVSKAIMVHQKHEKFFRRFSITLSCDKQSNSWRCHQMETFSALLAIFCGEFPGPRMSLVQQWNRQVTNHLCNQLWHISLISWVTNWKKIRFKMIILWKHSLKCHLKNICDYV